MGKDFGSMREFTLVAEIRDSRYGQTTLQHYVFDEDGLSDADCVHKLSSIAADWLEQHGNELDEGTFCDFNWGDFDEYVDDGFLARYGVRRTECGSAGGAIVDHDERLNKNV